MGRTSFEHMEERLRDIIINVPVNQHLKISTFNTEAKPGRIFVLSIYQILILSHFVTFCHSVKAAVEKTDLALKYKFHENFRDSL